MDAASLTEVIGPVEELPFQEGVADAVDALPPPARRRPSGWIGFGVEGYPYGLLTMIVSLEAIFLSTFVMISQNRADAKRQVIASQQWMTVQEEDTQNRELLDLSNQILNLTKAIHARTDAHPDSA